MIKFFRHFRQAMIKENRASKYLLYAIGEIVLVVIGILVALSINNANDIKKLKNKERILLTEMSRNLTHDRDDLRGNVEANRERLHANEMVLSALQSQQPMNDSLKYFYANVLGNYQLSENTASWENLKSVGMDLISDDSLRNSISNLYTTKYKYLENLEKDLDDQYQWNVLYPQILEHINIDALWVKATPVDHEGLMENRKFLEVLKMNIFFRNYIQRQYEIIEGDVTALLGQIEKHIESLD